MNEKVTREKLAQALRPFADFACDLEQGETIENMKGHCFNCRARFVLSCYDAEKNTVTRLPHWWPVQPPEYEGEDGRTIDDVIECWDHTGDAEESYRPLAEWAVKIGFTPILDAETNPEAPHA